MTEITVLVPTTEVPPSPIGHLAARRPLADGWVLALVANGKPRAQALLYLVAEVLGDRIGAPTVELHAKASAAKPLPAADAAAIAARATIAIAAIGDCGACSACSIDDAAQLERLGVPTTVVVTEPFQALAARFAVKVGMADLAVAVVPHPVASRDDETLRTYARSIADQVVAQLPTGTPA